ncbi:MAG: hypothetical protein ACI4PK_00195 [Oscillospiraceae bacterium]
MVRLAQVVLKNFRAQAVIHPQQKVVALLKALVVEGQLVTLIACAYQECDIANLN